MSIPFKSDLLKLPKNWDGVEEYTEILTEKTSMSIGSISAEEDQKQPWSGLFRAGIFLRRAFGMSRRRTNGLWLFKARGRLCGQMGRGACYIKEKAYLSPAIAVIG